ncbi:MAG: ATP-binding cassette domain-containing protein [Clostridia bacterium]|nr:ATP-binding cassette domain-containing protein [Clostridia bacterium]
MKVIEVKDLAKTFKVKVKDKGLKGSIKAIFKPKYEEIKAVRGVSFEVEEGEVIAFIGPNGAGKSTTIKMMTGILYPDGGEISVLGLDPKKDRKKLAYQIGTVFGQKEQLWMHLTPFDNFKFFAAIYDIPEKKAEEKIAELTELFGLEKFMNTPVRNLSLGQRIRCEIVASLIHEPKILFLDEPTIGLDPVIKENIRTLIKKMNKELKTTIFLTSHDISDIEKLCKRVMIINNGEVVLNDTMSNLKYHYLNKKIIEAKLEKSLKLDDIQGINILKNSNGNLKLEIDTSQTSTSKVIETLGLDNIKDINISNIPLETIISEIYRKEQPK